MRKLLFLLFAITIWFGCSIDEENISSDPSLNLIFSTDTVAFDTLLSSRRSSTRRLSVINPNKSAIQFSSISLGNGNASDYRVIINGREISSVFNEVLLGGDSLLVLVEINVTPRNEDEPYLVKDSIVFDWNTNSENIKLVAYGQDGIKKTKNTICDEIWTNDRPYIISDSLLLASDCELIIEKGTKVYFENNAALFIQGTLTAIGDSAEHIEFRNARFDGIYNDVPGQWNGIYFLEGSTNNRIVYTDIFNGQFGLRVGTPDSDDDADLIIENTIIYNMSVAGILAFTSDIEVTNTLIYNCGIYLVGNFAGGNYAYQHCTFSNEPSLFVREEPSVQFSDNILLSDDEILTDDLVVTVANSIIWGSGDEELLINNGGGSSVLLVLNGNIIRSSQELENNFTSQKFNFPGFRDPFLLDYSLDTLAFAKDKGIALGIDIDLLGAFRDINPDIGAFERIEK